MAELSQGIRSQIVETYMKTSDGRRRLLVSMDYPSQIPKSKEAAREMLSIAESIIRKSAEEGESLLEDEKISSIVGRLREMAGVATA